MQTRTSTPMLDQQLVIVAGQRKPPPLAVLTVVLQWLRGHLPQWVDVAAIIHHYFQQSLSMNLGCQGRH
jgi:hypothetical protein